MHHLNKFGEDKTSNNLNTDMQQNIQPGPDAIAGDIA